MKIKAIITGLVISLMLAINANSVKAQEKTYLEESGEAQDSAAMNDLYFGLEEVNQGPSKVLIIGIIAVVVVGGAVFYFMRKKK